MPERDAIDSIYKIFATKPQHKCSGNRRRRIQFTKFLQLNHNRRRKSLPARGIQFTKFLQLNHNKQGQNPSDCRIQFTKFLQLNHN